MKNFIIAILVIVAIGFGAYFLFPNSPDTYNAPEDNQDSIININKGTTTDDDQTIKTQDEMQEGETVIGKSVEGRDIKAYHYGDGDTDILFIAGIHGGYEWNTTLLAYEAMDYFEVNPDAIPDNVKLTIIPVLNPDGLDKVVGTSGRFTSSDVPTSSDTTIGRFNANEVDLNRNFDCDWKATGTWQDKTVSGGTKAFSEPESIAIKNYVEKTNPEAVIAWYSAAGGVFSSSCNNGISSETSKLTSLYSKTSGYPSYEEFDSYQLTGDMVNWLAKKNIPAISVLLTDHKNIEWSKNKAGIEAILNNYAK